MSIQLVIASIPKKKEIYFKYLPLIIDTMQNSFYCFHTIKSDYFINFLFITILKNALNNPFLISYPVNFSTLVSQNNAGLNFDKSGCSVSSFSIK